MKNKRNLSILFALVGVLSLSASSVFASGTQYLSLKNATISYSFCKSNDEGENAKADGYVAVELSSAPKKYVYESLDTVEGLSHAELSDLNVESFGIYLEVTNALCDAMENPPVNKRWFTKALENGEEFTFNVQLSSEGVTARSLRSSDDRRRLR